MRTAVVSDLHLGKAARHDLLRRPALRAKLIEGIEGADRLVLLGDVLELREGPVATALAAAEPLFAELAEAFAGKPITLLAGNHDHQLAGPLLDAAALGGGPGTLSTVNEHRPERSAATAVGRIATWLAATDLTLAYPGIWLRDDVYATHGHYMDFHGTVPTVELLSIGLAQRAVAHRGRDREQMTPAQYEAVLAPVYELAYALAQSSNPDRQLAGGGHSVAIWERLNGEPDSIRARVEVAVATRALIPAAVAGLNKLGLGPFRPELTGAALRRAGLRSIARAVAALGIDAGHVIFGHTHRSGPWPGDTEGWDLPNGGRLWNSGSWIHEAPFLGDAPLESPYFPGVVVWVDDDPGSPPRLERLLGESDLV